ncbi:MAG: hypothetical protein CL843_05140 [Crocinitomicaceae bacterium]|nr:hypothetical protein [Crocinitomicaceae bacterium]|tara:strand:+ start:10169 stop:11308 length:1140 start_codon:yes stop_codon:yes gene_type:complete
MKKFKFNSKSSVIKGIEETPVKKGINWDRIIYFAALAVVIFSFGSYFIGRYLVVKAESEVIIHKFDVNFPEDIIVNSYNVEEGDTVKKGDILFYYRNNFYKENDGVNIAINNGSRNDEYSKSTENWLLREQISTERDLNLKSLELNKDKATMNELQQGMDRLKKEVFLDIYPPSKLQEAEDKVENLKISISGLNQEINYLRSYLNEINARLLGIRAIKPEYSNEETQVGSASSMANFVNNKAGESATFDALNIPYYAPKGGMISQIYAEPDETTYESQLVMDMIELKDVHIKAYFKQEALNYINEGDIVDITFPDGTKSKGVIDKIYVKTTNLPDRLYETGSDLERRIRAIVIPLKIDDTDKWFRFYKINVTVSKSKYF